MCFGGGKQPAAPVNPAPYSLEDSHSAIEQTATTDLSMGDDEEDTAPTSTQARDNTKSTVRGGSGVNADPLSM